MKKKLLRATLTVTLALTASINANANTDCQLLTNVKGYTSLDDSQQLHEFEWLAMQQGKVLATGQAGKSKPFEKCVKIDGKGRYLLPGLVDAHGHVSGLGNEMSRVILRGLSSEAESAATVKAFANKNPQARWILGRGWNQVLWLNKTFPTKKSLDDLNIDRPIWLRRIDGHAAWGNSQALKLAGITKQTPDPEGGKIERDTKGNATGVLIDNAMSLVESKIPAASSLELEHAFDKAYAHLLSLGITSVHDAGISQNEVESFVARSKANRLPIRIYGMLQGSDKDLNEWLKKGPINDKQDFLSIRSVKLYADGALGSRGAAMLEPYSDDIDNHGLLVTEPKQLDRLVASILNSGFQVNVHAIGDKGNQLVMNAFEKAYKTAGGRELRNRIEHAQIIAPQDIPRFKTLDLIASMQPVHATSDKNMAGDRIGKARLVGAYAWQKLLQQGTIIASGSDFPVELANPFHGLHAAITRQDKQNQPKDGWLPGEKMTPAQALRSFTLDAAYAAHQEKTLGSLEVGKWADFILLDSDPIKGEPQNIWKTQVEQTWIAGELRYQKSAE